MIERLRAAGLDLNQKVWCVVPGFRMDGAREILVNQDLRLPRAAGRSCAGCFFSCFFSTLFSNSGFTREVSLVSNTILFGAVGTGHLLCELPRRGGGVLVLPVSLAVVSRVQFPPVTEVNRSSTFALRRSTLEFCLGWQRFYLGRLPVGTCSVHMHRKSSPALSPSSPRHPRLLGLITWCHSISGSTPLFSCAKARWFA